VTDLTYVGATPPGRVKRRAKRRASAALALVPFAAPTPPSAPATPVELAERLGQLAAALRALSKEPSWSAMRRGVEAGAEEAAALAVTPGLEEQR
jgi:hypothetical protein